MHHKHLTDFEIRKPNCQLHAPFVLTVITYSLVEMERWSLQHRIAAVDCLSKNSLLLHNVISVSSFKDVILRATIL
jgi:hypothetical protein